MTTPTLIDTTTSRPSSTNGVETAAISRSATGAGVDRVADAGEQHRELVAAEPRQRALAVESGDGIGASQRLLEPTRDAHQELVAGGVAEAVVDDLEAIDVEEEHGEVAGFRRRGFVRSARSADP